MNYLKDYLNLGKTCNRCNITYEKAEQYKYFYSSHHSTIELNICKSCIKEMLDINDISQVKLVLQALDIPFIEDIWNKKIDYHGKDGNIIGRYIAHMNLGNLSGFTYKDSELLNEINEKREKQRAMNIYLIEDGQTS